MIFAFIAGVIYLPGLIEIQELRAKREELRQEVQRLKKENASLAEEKELLKKDIGYVERVARKQMGVVRKGERPLRVIMEE